MSIIGKLAKNVLPQVALGTLQAVALGTMGINPGVLVGMTILQQITGSSFGGPLGNSLFGFGGNPLLNMLMPNPLMRMGLGFGMGAMGSLFGPRSMNGIAGPMVLPQLDHRWGAMGAMANGTLGAISSGAFDNMMPGLSSMTLGGDPIGDMLTPEEQQMYMEMTPKEKQRFMLQKKMQDHAEMVALLSQIQAMRHQMAMQVINNIR